MPSRTGAPVRPCSPSGAPIDAALSSTVPSVPHIRDDVLTALFARAHTLLGKRRTSRERSLQIVTHVMIRRWRDRGLGA
jgi:hypothetical protein